MKPLHPWMLKQKVKSKKQLNYSQKIVENIGRILDINPKRISIKGKTSESMGFIGRQEGIAAMAITSAQIPEIVLDD